MSVRKLKYVSNKITIFQKIDILIFRKKNKKQFIIKNSTDFSEM